MLQAKRRQPLNDGIAEIYTVTNKAEPGDLPVQGLSHVLTLRFEERIRGYNRLAAAKQNGEQLDRLIRVFYVPGLSTKQIIIIDNIQYLLTEVQIISDTTPTMADLSLQRWEGSDYGDIIKN